MVARTPPLAKEKRAVAAALNPALIRETVKKVDRCLARLQQLQYTAHGGRKVVGGASLSPRSTKGYLRTSLRCKQEATHRMKSNTSQRSPPGKFPPEVTPEWRQMSLPAMLLGETVTEIVQATQFARQAVAATTTNKAAVASPDPKTPVTARRARPGQAQNGFPDLKSRRTREKQQHLRTPRSGSVRGSPLLPRARTRISFKGSSPQSRREATYRHMVAAQRASPKNRPWALKKTTLLFPNHTFHPSSSSQQRQMMKLPEKARSRRSPPHKFVMVKSPVGPRIRAKSKSKSPPPGPGMGMSTTPVKQRRSFSPAKLAYRLVSPLKGRISAAYNGSSGKRRRRRSTGGALAAAGNPTL